MLICSKSIVLVTGAIRAIISHDKIVVIGPDASNPVVSVEESDELLTTIKELLEGLQFGGIKGRDYFEFRSVFIHTLYQLCSRPSRRALEVLLLLTVRGFDKVATKLQEQVYAILPELRQGISPAELRDLLDSKRTVDECIYSGRALQTALATVLGADEDLAAMYLTDKQNGKIREPGHHQTAELLLEYCACDARLSTLALTRVADERRLDQTNESSSRLASLLDDIDSNIQLVLASTRLRLQHLELSTAIATLSLAVGATVGSFFGQNLESGLEEHPTAFYWVTGASCGLMVAVLAIGWIRMLRARRSQLFLGSAARERQATRAKLRRLSPTNTQKRRELSEKSDLPAERKDGTEI